MKIQGQKILITGGASGIGLAMAARFIEDGNTVIICGRRKEKLDEAKAAYSSLITRQCDLSVDEERRSLYDWVVSDHPDTNVLINNAGIQNWMSLDDADFSDKAAIEIDINCLAPVHLCHLFQSAPALHTIMNVTSGLAFVPLVKTPVYAATKAFLHSFTVTLRHLFKRQNQGDRGHSASFKYRSGWQGHT